VPDPPSTCRSSPSTEPHNLEPTESFIHRIAMPQLEMETMALAPPGRRRSRPRPRSPIPPRPFQPPPPPSPAWSAPARYRGTQLPHAVTMTRCPGVATVIFFFFCGRSAPSTVKPSSFILLTLPYSGLLHLALLPIHLALQSTPAGDEPLSLYSSLRASSGCLRLAQVTQVTQVNYTDFLFIGYSG
jgi:hypothetical protein